jgi:hypothetical protein
MGQRVRRINFGERAPNSDLPVVAPRGGSREAEKLNCAYFSEPLEALGPSPRGRQEQPGGTQRIRLAVGYTSGINRRGRRSSY